MSDTTQTVVFSIASLFSKIPILYLVMLIWSGIVIGLGGQAVLLLSYTIAMTVAYVIIRPLMISSMPYDGSLGKLFYTLPESMRKASGVQQDFASLFMGIPSTIARELFGTIDTSFFSKYLFMGFPDAMIFPSSFLYGYSLMSSEDGLLESRNLFIFFFLIMSSLIQNQVMDMHIVAVIANIFFGIILGTLASSLITDVPSLKPFNVNNQSFRIVVRNNQ